MNMDKDQNILNFFKKAKENGRLSHGYLFWGQNFDEMRNTAFKLAEFLKTDPFDILYIVPLKTKQEISIDQIRDLKKHLSLSPYNSQYKFAIIDKAELLSRDAGDALLKTLEEPQGNTILIVIAPNPDLLPQTIVSRLEAIRFKGESLDKISDKIIQTEHIEILKKPLNDIFKYIERVSKDNKENKDNNSEIFSILDSWLLWFRGKMIEKQDFLLAEKIKNINSIKNLISSTNVNQRLALENLVLEISGGSTS
jgi:DNA polymerase III gamma/tau subunit